MCKCLDVANIILSLRMKLLTLHNMVNANHDTGASQ